jgi:hypothetical protein
MREKVILSNALHSLVPAQSHGEKMDRIGWDNNGCHLSLVLTALDILHIEGSNSNIPCFLLVARQMLIINIINTVNNNMLQLN